MDAARVSPETLAALRDIASIRGEDYEDADAVLAKALLEMQTDLDRLRVPRPAMEQVWE